MCGFEYGTSSLAMHQKTCAKKHAWGVEQYGPDAEAGLSLLTGHCTPGCQIGHIWTIDTGCHQLNVVLTHNNNVVRSAQPYAETTGAQVSLHSLPGVSGWLHGLLHTGSVINCTVFSAK
jgi:hypothetical protein